MCWHLDHFNAIGVDTLEDMCWHFPDGRSTTDNLQAKLATTTHQKQQCIKIVREMIDNFFVIVGNACGLRVVEYGVSRMLANRKDLQTALLAFEPLEERFMLLHFIVNYVWDGLYPLVVHFTHQQTVEHAIRSIMHMEFIMPEVMENSAKNTSRIKSCVAKLYGYEYNKIKHRVLTKVLPSQVMVSLEHKAVQKKAFYKRDKMIFFVHITDVMTKKIKSTEVCYVIH